MTSIRFGLVQEIQFTNAAGVSIQPRRCDLAQNLDNQGAVSQPAFGVFNMDETCGIGPSPSYLVYNGPNDNDGDTFSREATDLNNRYMQLWPLNDQQRADLLAEKTALFQKYLDKLSGIIAVKAKSDTEFEF